MMKLFAHVAHGPAVAAVPAIAVLENTVHTESIQRSPDGVSCS